MKQASHLRPVEQEDPPATESRNGGNGHNGGGRGSEGRLRDAEIRLERIETKLDTQLGHLATKNDVTKVKNDVTEVKVWVLSGVLGGMAVAAGIAVAVARFWPS